MLGKHTDNAIVINNLKETIKRKDKEIQDIKISLADVLKEIVRLNTSNTCNTTATRRKITELAKDTQYELMKDIVIENDEKIIELSSSFGRRLDNPINKNLCK